MNFIIGALLFFLGTINSGLMVCAGIGVAIVNPTFGVPFLISYWVGIFINSQLLLPLVYSLPKSIYLYVHRRINFWAIPACFIAPIIWQIILIIIYIFVEKVHPSFNAYLGTNEGANLGWLFSGISLIYSVYFTKSGKKSALEDYNRVFVSRYSRILSTNDQDIIITCGKCYEKMTYHKNDKKTTIRCSKCSTVHTIALER